MTDRELLELAAKAAGIAIKPLEIKNVEYKGDDRFIGFTAGLDDWPRGWFNPLNNDGDALRLAVKLGLTVAPANGSNSDITEAYRNSSILGRSSEGRAELHGSDPMAATRRAIVRAAAEIGRGIA